jgi:hypothetical protein
MYKYIKQAILVLFPLYVVMLVCVMVGSGYAISHGAGNVPAPRILSIMFGVSLLLKPFLYLLALLFGYLAYQSSLFTKNADGSCAAKKSDGLALSFALISLFSLLSQLV